MAVSIFEGCSESCGWVAAIIAVMAWGSFGVPIKANAKVEVDPLVMQSYKTIVCFLTSWLVVFMGEEVRWTPWGIVSGLFWVPGALCGIYGIRNAGLAIAVGTWSSISVLFSFLWGILVFKEGVKDINQTAAAFVVLGAGLVGMSKYSKPKKRKILKDAEMDTLSLNASNSSTDAELPKESLQKESVNYGRVRKLRATPAKSNLSRSASPVPKSKSSSPNSSGLGSKLKVLSMEIEPLISSSNSEDDLDYDDNKRDLVTFFGGRLALNRHQMGVLGAVINGAWGSTSLIPMHYAAKEGFGGANYIISFGSGSMLVCIGIWFSLYLYNVFFITGGRFRESLDLLPRFHLRELGLPGLLAGSLYSLGNFCSILAVTYLGQGVGFSFCQCSILVSGLWGIFYYHEISGRDTIIRWLLSAVVTIIGILLLSYEHEGSLGHR